MRARILTFLAVLVLVAGCSSKPQDTGAVAIDTGDFVSETVTTTTVESVGVVPGSEQDLVVNVGDRVFFSFDSYALMPEGRATLERQAAWLRQYPNVNLILEGNCDERGTREYNLALGEKRAMAAKNYLVSLGIDANRLQTISYGKERPAVAGNDEAAWAQNRRTVSVVQ